MCRFRDYKMSCNNKGCWQMLSSWEFRGDAAEKRSRSSFWVTVVCNVIDIQLWYAIIEAFHWIVFVSLKKTCRKHVALSYSLTSSFMMSLFCLRINVRYQIETGLYILPSVYVLQCSATCRPIKTCCSHSFVLKLYCRIHYVSIKSHCFMFYHQITVRP